MPKLPLRQRTARRQAGSHVRPHCWWARPRGHQRGPEGRPHSDDGGRDEFPECCPTRVSRSRTRSCSCVIVARSSRMVACYPAFVAQSSTTSACRVATTDGITHQNVQRNRPGTLPPVTVTRLRGMRQPALPLAMLAHGYNLHSYNVPMNGLYCSIHLAGTCGSGNQFCISIIPQYL